MVLVRSKVNMTQFGFAGRHSLQSNIHIKYYITAPLKRTYTFGVLNRSIVLILNVDTKKKY